MFSSSSVSDFALNVLKTFFAGVTDVAQWGACTAARAGETLEVKTMGIELTGCFVKQDLIKLHHKMIM